MLHQNPSLTFFAAFRAEEFPLQGDVFISPSGFGRMKENYSIIVYGKPGQGKTSLRFALQSQAGEKILPVSWIPEPITAPDEKGTQLAQKVLAQALQACVESAVCHGQLTSRLANTSPAIRNALAWFMQTYLPMEPMFYVQTQNDHLSMDEINWFCGLFQQPVGQVIRQGASQSDEIRLFLLILKHAGYDAIWLLVDNLEKWPQQIEAHLVEMLSAVLSTLVMFSMSGMVYKFFIPDHLKSLFRRTAAVERNRVTEIEWGWTTDHLINMLEKRLQKQFNVAVSFSSICLDDVVLNWLLHYGGSNPRAWLTLFQPIIQAYSASQSPLSSAECQEIFQSAPPLLRLEIDRREVWVGEKCISFGSEEEYKILTYLYQRPGKICSIEEIYYCALRSLDKVPEKNGENWLHRDYWRPSLDTKVWRIRKKIEFNPEIPAYLITHERRGIELNNISV